MRKIFVKLWKDDSGVVAFEYLLVATVVSLSLVVGLGAVSLALNHELSSLANAILTLNQTYSVSAQSTCSAGSGIGSSSGGSYYQDYTHNVSYGNLNPGAGAILANIGADNSTPCP